MERPPWAEPLGLGAWTDLAVQILGGARVEPHADHLVVRSPHNRSAIWGNHVEVLADGEDVERWLAVFAAAFPDAGHVAIGLPPGVDPAVWARRGLPVATEDVLVGTGVRPPGRGIPAGLDVRPLRADADWAAMTELMWDENERTGLHPRTGYRAFLERLGAGRRRVAEAGEGVFLGAWSGAGLVGHVGIVDCAPLARFQTVVTRADQRRRGIATALIAACSRWATERGLARQVILADTGSAAAGLYRGLGFVPDEPVVGVSAEHG